MQLTFGLAVLERPGLGGMPAERLGERDVEEIGKGAAGVVADQGGKHRALVVGVEDALEVRRPAAAGSVVGQDVLATGQPC